MQNGKAELCQLEQVNRRAQLKSFLVEFVVYDDTVVLVAGFFGGS